MVSDTSNVVIQPVAPGNPGNPVIPTPLGPKIMVLDYHDLYLNCLLVYLKYCGFNVIGYSNNEAEFRKLLMRNRKVTDIAIVNYKTTKRETLEVARFTKEKYPHIKVVINTQYAGGLFNKKIKAMGIEGVILKTGYETEHIIKILLGVYHGKTFFDS